MLTHLQKSKSQSFSLAFIASALLLSGCGGGDDDEDKGKDDRGGGNTEMPVLSLEEKSVREGHSGETLIAVDVSLSSRSSETEEVTFDYELIQGTATADVDYKDEGGTVKVKPGVRRTSFEVVAFGDTAFEDDEWFEVRIRNSKNAKIDRKLRKTRVTIENDDEIPTAYFTTAEQVVSEISGSASLVFAIDSVSGFDTEARLEVTGTAKRGDDYKLSESLDISISAGELSYSIPVQIEPDAIPEGGETIIFNIDRLSNAQRPDVRSGLSNVSTVIIAGDIALNDTGVTTFSDGNQLHGATFEPSSAPVQDGSVGLDVTQNNNRDGHAGFSFTKLDLHGNPLDANAVTWACVRDNTTGLVWEEKMPESRLLNMQKWRAQNYNYTWYEADETINGGSSGAINNQPRMDKNEPTGDFCTYLPERDAQDRRHELACNVSSYVNSLSTEGLCGFNDWRVPEVNELRSIYSYSSDTESSHPDSTFFANTVTDTGHAYWTATPAADNKASSWCIGAGVGDIRLCKKDSGQQIRAVRSAQGVSQ